jgi:hypothetical protein
MSQLDVAALRKMSCEINKGNPNKEVASRSTTIGERVAGYFFEIRYFMGLEGRQDRSTGVSLTRLIKWLTLPVGAALLFGCLGLCRGEKMGNDSVVDVWHSIPSLVLDTADGKSAVSANIAGKHAGQSIMNFATPSSSEKDPAIVLASFVDRSSPVELESGAEQQREALASGKRDEATLRRTFAEYSSAQLTVDEAELYMPGVKAHIPKLREQTLLGSGGSSSVLNLL